MIDSCSPSKLDPGLAAAYSMPRLLITSTMKSDAGFSTRRDEAPLGGGSVSARSWVLPGAAGTAGRAEAGACAAAPAGALRATSAAALTAAPFRKRRRPTEDLFVATPLFPFLIRRLRRAESTRERLP